MLVDESGCGRLAAVGGVHSSHHNYQLPLLGLGLVLIGGGAIQHFLSRVPLPYTVLLLLFGVLLGCWVMFDENFTLQPGTLAGAYEWNGHALACNTTDYVPNDLFNHGFHLGNSLRALAS